MLVTNLANRVQPSIRYEVDDHLALATEPCTCGRPRIVSKRAVACPLTLMVKPRQSGKPKLTIDCVCSFAEELARRLGAMR